jgi:hypothetical protein
MHFLGISPNRLLAAVLIALGFAAAPAAAQLPLVSMEETPAEIHLAADFTGNGLVDALVLDRTSGAFRLGRQVAAGSFVWDEPQSSGIGGVTGATAGIFFGAPRYALAVASPEANRVSFFDFAAPGNGPLPSYLPNTLGPAALVSGQIAGSTALEDLLITSELNDGPNVFRETRFINNPAGTLASAGASGSTSPYHSPSRVVIKTSLSSAVGYMQGTGSLTLRVRLMEVTGAPIRLTVTGLPADSRYLLVPFGGATLGTLLTYVPGESSMTRRSISESPADTFAAGAGSAVVLPFPVASISAVKGGGVVRLALLNANRERIAIYNFDGTALGSLVQMIDAPAGVPLSAIAALGNSEGFVVTRSAGPGRGTNGAQAHLWNGGSGQFGLASSQSFPEIAPRAGAANVTLLTAEPFVVPSARPVSLRNARDWTSGSAPAIPGPVNVTAEVFRSEPLGLGDPVGVNLGSSPAGASFALLNQYSPAISVFTLSRAGGAQIGQIGVSPAPGLYSRAVELRFSSLPTGLTVFYRDAGGAWQTYVEPGLEPEETDAGYAAWFAQFAALVRFKETTIEYYGQDGAGRRTPIRRAEYRFTAPPATLSSLGDNVPDYVKLGLGINPFRLPTGESAAGVANSLQRALRGSGIDPRWLAGSAFDLYVRPLSHDGASNPATPSRLATEPVETLPDGTESRGNQIFVYSLSGGLLGQGVDPIPGTPTRNEGLGLYNPPFTQPSAKITNLGGTGGSVLLAATRVSYALGGTLPPASEASARGREMFGLIPASAPAFSSYQRAYTNSSNAVEAAAWVAGATTFYSGQPPPVVAETVDSLDTLAALVFERWLLQRFVDRGLLPASYQPPVPDAATPPLPNPDFLTLSGFRTRETAFPMHAASAGPATPTEEALAAVEQWQPLFDAYRLTDAAANIRQAVRNSADPGIAALRSVALDIFRISAAHSSAFPGLFDPPIDALRLFIATGAVPDPYSPSYVDIPGAPFSSLAPSVYANALNGLAACLAIPQPRPFDLFLVELRSDSLSYSGCLVVNEAFFPSNLFSLFNRDGVAFRLPANFSLLPGTRIQLLAFTDAPFAPCSGAALEVIELDGAPFAEIQLIPVASASDADGNLLGDEWELAFFGNVGVDPWADLGNDGYTNLQKYLDGKDPFVYASYSIMIATDLALPTLYIEAVGPGQALISFEFPEAYAGALQFQLFHSATLTSPWLPAPHEIVSPLPGVFQVLVPSSPANAGFWRVGVSLK